MIPTYVKIARAYACGLSAGPITATPASVRRVIRDMHFARAWLDQHPGYSADLDEDLTEEFCRARRVSRAYALSLINTIGPRQREEPEPEPAILKFPGVA